MHGACAGESTCRLWSIIVLFSHSVEVYTVKVLLSVLPCYQNRMRSHFARQNNRNSSNVQYGRAVAASMVRRFYVGVLIRWDLRVSWLQYAYLY